jgi:hypothetical protein
MLNRQRCRLLGIVSLSATALIATAMPASSSLFLDDWGVAYDNWDVDSFGGLSTYYTEDWKPGDNPDGYLGPGHGGDDYDVEALYFGVDSDYYYFAVVTGFAPGGRDGYEAGDVFVDLEQDGVYDIAFDHSEDGQMVSGITETEDSMKHDGTHYAEADPFRVVSYTGAPYSGHQYSYAEFSGRYAIEIKIDREMLGDVEDVHLHWTMGCGNDSGDLVASVPEPSTVLLLGLGLLGAGVHRIRRRRS